MAKISKRSASTVQSIEGLLESHSDQLEGYDVSFDRYDQDMDMTPLFKGLPDDRCQCPHWGYVFKGKVGYTYADQRGDRRGRRSVLCASRPHAPALRRQRGPRVQPQ